MLSWQPVPTTDHWALVDSESEMVVRLVAPVGPYLGDAAVIFRVSGPGYEATDHASRDAAMAAAEESAKQL